MRTTAGGPVPQDRDERPSRSQVKRELLALQKLAQQLVALHREILDGMPLGTGLREAVDEAQRIASHGARRRQIRRIGKLLRFEDPELIRLVGARAANRDEGESRRFHAAEGWRERLLGEGGDAVTEFIGRHPQADVQYLRQLVRAALREREQGKPPGAGRKLFRYIRELE